MINLLGKDTGKQRREIEELLTVNPQQALIRFQSQPTERARWIAQWVILPTFGLVVLGTWALGKNPLTLTFGVIYFLATCLWAVLLVMGSRVSLSRQRMIKQFSAESGGVRSPAEQRRVVEQCIAAEFTRGPGGNPQLH